MHSTGVHCVVQLINVLCPLELGFAWMPLHGRGGLNNGRVTGEETSQLPKTYALLSGTLLFPEKPLEKTIRELQEVL